MKAKGSDQKTKGALIDTVGVGKPHGRQLAGKPWSRPFLLGKGGSSFPLNRRLETGTGALDEVLVAKERGGSWA